MFGVDYSLKITQPVLVGFLGILCKFSYNIMQNKSNETDTSINNYNTSYSIKINDTSIENGHPSCKSKTWVPLKEHQKLQKS